MLSDKNKASYYNIVPIRYVCYKRKGKEERGMFQGKTVLLGVTGSIAAYKIAGLASALKKRHADVHVLMTQNATNFINPITFETLTGN